ncbi:M12 family metallopeptidase [Nocardia gipuzkoensis]|uniref:M12 family metallopeptidase n=1 Tax=Nocardia gipuzkoensis TaxID=2749991 RepID=UPI00237DD606|nr:M12 family metallopeptidase [Nocardia gipuzkoensis]MDE1675096.1 M12 family metallopeptidase [Nocardia gipuzkoensis]
MGCGIPDNDGRRWPYGIVPVALGPGASDVDAAIGASIETQVKSARTEWELTTPVRFVDHSTEADFIEIRGGGPGRCNSAVGRQGGKQTIYCRASVGGTSVIHELGHVLGLHHEQQRLDRDAMVAVSAFAIKIEPENYKREDDALMLGQYDFDSAMHYRPSMPAPPPDAPAVARGMMTKLHPDPFNKTGRPSATDLFAIRQMYGAVPPNTPTAVYGRNKNHMEMWAIGESGWIRGIWFDRNQWHSWYDLVIPGAVFPAGGHLAALGRLPNHMEVFGVANDGTLRGVWWNGKWQPGYSLGHPAQTSLLPGAPLAVLTKNSRHMEVWTVGQDGILYGVWWKPSGWQPWFQLPGRGFPVGSPTHLTALTRSGNHAEVWAVDTRGQLVGTWFDGAKWQWYDLPRSRRQPEEGLVPGGGVASLSRNGAMEVWAITNSGQLAGCWWDKFTWRDQYVLGTGMVRGAPVTARSRSKNHMEVWTIDSYGNLVAFVFNGGWKVPPSPFPINNQKWTPGGPVSSWIRHDKNMEVFTVGPYAQAEVPQTTWWSVARQWQGPTALM